MRLLFDENLSHELVLLLADLFPESVHVRGAVITIFDDDDEAAFLALS